MDILRPGDKRSLKHVEGSPPYWRWQTRRYHKAQRRTWKAELAGLTANAADSVNPRWRKARRNRTLPVRTWRQRRQWRKQWAGLIKLLRVVARINRAFCELAEAWGHGKNQDRMG
jgi:hypothetical protein